MKKLNTNINEEHLENAAIELENKRLREKYEKKLKGGTGLESKRSIKLTLLIASMVLVLAISFVAYNFFLNSEKTGKQVEQYIANAEYYSDPAISSRGVGGDDDAKIVEAEKLLLEGKVKEAIVIFEEIDSELLSPIQNLNLALAYIKNKDHEKAAQQFDMLNDNQSNFIQEIQYLEVLNMVKLGKYDEAKPLMREIVDKKQYKWKEVNAILYSLN